MWSSVASGNACPSSSALCAASPSNAPGSALEGSTVTDKTMPNADVGLQPETKKGQGSAESARRVGDDYVLPTGREDRSRLDLIHAVYGPISRQGLDAARISEATRVADIGCGSGTVSRGMAQRIKTGGSVDAIDIAE